MRLVTTLNSLRSQEIRGVPTTSLATHSPQHRYLTQQENRTETPASYETMTFAQFLALPAISEVHGFGLGNRPHPDPAGREPGGLYRRSDPSERWGDLWPPEQGDLHVHLRAAQQRECGVSGRRNQQIVTEVTPHFQPPKTDWSYEALIDLCQRQVRVRISGWLMHDYAHIKDVGNWRASAWEIHPVTNIEVQDPERAEWRPVPVSMKTKP